MLQEVLGAIQSTFSAKRAAVSSGLAPEITGLTHATPVVDATRYGCAPWVQAIAPLRFSRGDSLFFMLGARGGGRRYLSEDIELLDRMAAFICERIERARNSEMESLVSQAELRALQAQINPHFFFNALNTLYGSIPRESVIARQLVLNLADLFRMSFASERTSIRIEEELKIVRAYLEIEQLRLGDKLRIEIDVDDLALSAEVPVLSIQPLVENAVKHGAASRASGGFVRLSIRMAREAVLIKISNPGSFQPALEKTRGNGVGLANVRQRLALCFGSAGELTVESDDEITTVGFSVPAKVDIRQGSPAVRGRR
jgi:two-component system LytT family sensor kinase